MLYGSIALLLTLGGGISKITRVTGIILLAISAFIASQMLIGLIRSG